MANEEFPKASVVTIRKVSGGFIVEYDAPGELPAFYLQQAQAGLGVTRPTVTRQHVVADLGSLEAFLARLFRE